MKLQLEKNEYLYLSNAAKKDLIRADFPTRILGRLTTAVDSQR